MTPAGRSESPVSQYSSLASALRDEMTSRMAAPRSITLFSGTFIGAFAGRWYYRFEIPEHITVQGIPTGTFSFGHANPLRLQGTFVAVENQYLTIALPHDFGPVLPESQCEWDVEPHFAPIIDLLSQPSPLGTLLLNPQDSENHHAVSFEAQMVPDTPAEQQDALSRILGNKISFVWGPILSGKTNVLAQLAVNYAKAGKHILFVDTVNERVDDLMVRAIEIARRLDTDVASSACVVGFPAVENFDKLGSLSLEQKAELLREEKRKSFGERVGLLRSYWRIRIKQILHEDSLARLTDIRERLSDRKKKIEHLSAEVGSLKEAVGKIQNASMMDRLKKGYGKDDLAVAQKKLEEKSITLKRMQSTLTALTHESLRIEASAPLTGEDQQEFNLTVKRIEELGGLKTVEEAVNSYTTIDEGGLLDGRTFIGTTLTTALTDPRLRRKTFDLVIIDDAESIALPFLAALATMAREKMVVSGDPYQLGPESVSPSVRVQEWYRRDAFLHLTGGERLQDLFEYAKAHHQWCIRLSSQAATTPKLSRFVAAALFDNMINVTVPQSARGRLWFIDTSSLQSKAKQYVGRRKILPHNELQMRKVLELVKHALMEPGRSASDVGVIIPFHGPTLYAKQQLRIHGMQNIEVGTPYSFRGRRKKAIVMDTVMAGVDHTMRPLDDRKIGDHQIVRLLNTVFSCAVEDLYVVADINHFNERYKDRLITRLLTLLRAESDPTVPFAQAAKQFDFLDWDQKAVRLSYASEPSPMGGPSGDRHSALKDDAEFAVQMRLLARKGGEKAEGTERNYERETYDSVHRVLGMLTDVNLLGQYAGHPLLFHRSYATEQAVAKLPITPALSEKDFRTVLEDWNLLVYEKSGGSKTDVPFFKQAPETRVRWDVNALKAFYSADVDAVVEEGKQKLAMAVSRIFHECIGKPQPGTPQEWHAGYLSFLTKLEGYLGWISEQLRK
jgi:hypothetical protein